MNIDLRIVGAGEFRSFRQDIQDTSYFVRLLRADGHYLDLQIEEAHLSQIVEFAATARETVDAGRDNERTPSLEESIPHEETEMPPVVLRPSREATRLFVSDDDDRDL